MAHSLTTGSPAKRIFWFALPLLVGNLFQQIYNMVDTLVVGRVLGVHSLAAVGAVGGVMFLLIGFCQAATSGFSIVTAQAFGARRPNEVRKSFCVSIILSVVIGVALTVVGVVWVREILEIMRMPPEIIEDAHAYLVVIYAGLGTFVAFNALANTILALGDSKTPLLFLAAACVLNIVLDLFFILGLGWGVEGAARATVIAQSASVALCIMYIAKKQPALLLRKKDWQSVTLRDLAHSARIGFPMGFQACVISLGIISVQWALNSLGPIAVAAHTVAHKIDIVTIMPLMSFGLAMATYTGQNYGAGDIGRIRKGVRQCCAMSLAFSIVAGAAVIVGGSSLVALFMGPEQPEVAEVTEYAQTYLNINASMYWVLSFLFVYRFSLQGLGKSFIPTASGVVELVMRVGAAVLLIGNFGFIGVCFANPLAWVGACVPLAAAWFLAMRELDATRAIKNMH